MAFQLAEAQTDLDWLRDGLQKSLDAPALTLGSERPGWWVLKGVNITPEVLAELTAHLAQRNVLVRSIEVDKRSLEDVFLDITGREMR